MAKTLPLPCGPQGVLGWTPTQQSYFDSVYALVGSISQVRAPGTPEPQINIPALVFSMSTSFILIAARCPPSVPWAPTRLECKSNASQYLVR